MKTLRAIIALSLALLCPSLVEANQGDFSGGVAIGTAYAGQNAAPTNGLIVQGNVGIGSASPASTLDVNGVLNANILTLNRVAVPITPTGRLTLSSTAAVMTSDVTSATTIYYLPYVGQNVPTYNGTSWTEQDIGSSGVSLTLSTTNMPTSETFDVYVSMQSGSPTLCALYWGSNTSHSSTAGGKSGTQDARIVQLNGLWVNKTAIAASNCYNSSTDYAIAQNQGTLLGSFHTSANGQTEWVCHPAAASGGGAVDMAVYNVFNQRASSCQNLDSVSNYTYTTATARIWNNSSANEDHWLDGLGVSDVYINSQILSESTNTGNAPYSGFALNSTTSSGQIGMTNGYQGTAVAVMMTNQASIAGVIGYNFLSPLQTVQNALGTVFWLCDQSQGGLNTNFCGTVITVNGL